MDDYTRNTIDMLRIAVQSKGRLHEETMALLREAGIKLSKEKRSLLLSAVDFPVEVLFLRNDDIPQSVANGVADVGIVGEDDFVEKGGDAESLKRLGFSKCRLSLAIPKDEEYKGLQWFQGKTIATSYPKILSGYLAKNGVKATLHEISGSVEIAPGIGLADAIFDIVSSGSTLISNQLREVDVVMKSEALLIAHKSLTKENRAILNELLFRFAAIQEASGKKYVLLNAPKEKVPEITEVLPGMKSPTITPLADEGWVSIQSVITETHFWEIIGKLKALGAESIIVVPIEKMIV
jgi:ATP phosphoribosyltransferase